MLRRSHGNILRFDWKGSIANEFALASPAVCCGRQFAQRPTLAVTTNKFLKAMPLLVNSLPEIRLNNYVAKAF